MNRKLLACLMILSLLFSFSGLVSAQVNADSIVILDDETVVLMTDDNSGVLGVTIADVKAAASSAPAAKSAPAPAKTETKSIPIVPANTPSVVQAAPSAKGDNKLQVTITTPPPAATKASTASTPTPIPVTNTLKSTTALSPKPSAGSSPAPVAPSSATSKATLPLASSVPEQASPVPAQTGVTPTTVNKNVDKVVLQAGNNPVVTIQPSTNQSANQSSQMTVSQGDTKITTTLPLNINTQTRVISTVLSNSIVQLNVLPDEAVKSVVSQGLIGSASVSTLEESNHQAVYNVQGEKGGLLFGMFPVRTPVEVKLSSQNGTVISVKESFTFRLFSAFIK